MYTPRSTIRHILHSFHLWGFLNNKMLELRGLLHSTYLMSIIFFMRFNNVILWLHGEIDRQNSYTNVAGCIVPVSHNIDCKRGYTVYYGVTVGQCKLSFKVHELVLFWPLNYGMFNFIFFEKSDIFFY